MQEAADCNVKGGLLQGKRPPFITYCVTVCYAVYRDDRQR